VRYIPEGADNIIRYGEPLLQKSQIDEIAQIAKEGKLEVNVLEGANALSAKPTGKVEKVAKLLGPLRPSDVPIIRCIGLNYTTHSK
jgi:hypothetical protein